MFTQRIDSLLADIEARRLAVAPHSPLADVRYTRALVWLRNVRDTLEEAEQPDREPEQDEDAYRLARGQPTYARLDRRYDPARVVYEGED